MRAFCVLRVVHVFFPGFFLIEFLSAWRAFSVFWRLTLCMGLCFSLIQSDICLSWDFSDLSEHLQMESVVKHGCLFCERR